MPYIKTLAITATLMLVSGCASTNNAPPQQAAPATQASKAPESRIDGNFPSNSAFAKLKLGMTQGQVHEILGQPTDSKQYQTGKMWIPFYFGPDMMRLDEFYKGVGIITFTGAGMGGVHWTVFRAVYNTAEDGFPDK